MQAPKSYVRELEPNGSQKVEIRIGLLFGHCKLGKTFKKFRLEKWQVIRWF